MSTAEEARDSVKALGPDEHPEEGLYEFGCRSVSKEYVDKRRWYSVVKEVWEFEDGSFLGVQYCEPATECQEGQEYDATAYLVEPYEVAVTKYRKI